MTRQPTGGGSIVVESVNAQELHCVRLAREGAHNGKSKWAQHIAREVSLPADEWYSREKTFLSNLHDMFPSVSFKVQMIKCFLAIHIDINFYCSLKQIKLHEISTSS